MSCVIVQRLLGVRLLVALLRRAAPWAAVARHVPWLRALWQLDGSRIAGKKWGNSGVLVGREDGPDSHAATLDGAPAPTAVRELLAAGGSPRWRRGHTAGSRPRLPRQATAVVYDRVAAQRAAGPRPAHPPGEERGYVGGMCALEIPPSFTRTPRPVRPMRFCVARIDSRRAPRPSIARDVRGIASHRVRFDRPIGAAYVTAVCPTTQDHPARASGDGSSSSGRPRGRCSGSSRHGAAQLTSMSSPRRRPHPSPNQ
jgi:hypothetical protein